jgi:hypothetical protein
LQSDCGGIKERLTMSREGEPSDMNRFGIEIGDNDATGMNTDISAFAAIASLESSPINLEKPTDR